MPTTLPKFYWHFAKKHLTGLLGIVFVALAWAIIMAMRPYALKVIIDTVADTSVQTQALFTTVWFPAALYVFLGFATGVIFRFNDWLLLNTFPKIKSAIIAEMFDYVQGHAYRYFQHTFAGSLANKINDMAKGATSVIHNLLELFLSRILFLITAAITMFSVHPYFPAVLITWGVIFVVVSFF